MWSQKAYASVKDWRYLVDSHPVFQVESIVKPGYGGIYLSPMKKFLLAMCLISLFVFSSCNAKIMPFKAKQFSAKQPRVFSVYVCGAVENEGYVDIFEGTDYQSLILSAGYIPQMVMPKTPYAVVREDVSTVVLNYFDGQKECYCINLNGAVVSDNLPCENVSPQVIEKLHNYVVANGKISDRALLKQILGNDYQDNFYKFFVSESDYEKVC